MKTYDPLAPFTREMFLTMTEKEVREFWVARQMALRAQGKKHHTHLIDPATGDVVYRLPESGK